MQEEVVRNDRRTDKPHDEKEVATAGQSRHQQPVQQADRPRCEDHCGRDERDRHHGDEPHEHSLHQPISARPQEPERRESQADHGTARRPAEQRRRSQRTPDQIARLERGVPHADGRENETDRRDTRQGAGESVADRISEARSGYEPEPRGHLLKDQRRQHREQESPQQRHAVLGTGERGRRHGAGTDERGRHDGPRTEAPERVAELHSWAHLFRIFKSGFTFPLSGIDRGR